MYKISEDLEKELQNKYPGVHIPTIVHMIFQSILEKTFSDGACHIREFGKFVSYKTESVKTGGEAIRFKFKISSSLDKKIKKDPYLIQNIPVKAKCEFNEINEQKVSDKQHIKTGNFQACHEASRLANKITKEKMIQMEVKNIFENE